jgi:tetratricopeptide (TPR) repeat protein
MGLLAYFQLDYEKARALDFESLSLFRALGDDEGVANILVNLGDVVRHEGDLSTAYSLYAESAEIARGLRDQWGLAYAILGLADVAFQQGELSTATSLYRECLTMLHKGADYVGLPFGLESVAAMLLAKNQTEKSARIFAAAHALRQRTNSPRPLPDSAAYQTNMWTLKQQLDESKFDAVWTEGLNMPLEQAVELAINEPGNR